VSNRKRVGNDSLKGIWQETIQPISKYYSSISLEELREKPQKDFCQYCQSQGQY
jgi:hypothetical protein